MAKKLTLKKVIKIYDSDEGSKTIARNVLNPPFQTAGPMYCNAFVALSVE